MEQGKHLTNKGRFWLGLSVGLFLGIALAISFYFIDKYAFIQSLHLQKKTVVSTPDTIVQIVEKNNYYNHVVKEPMQPAETELLSDTLAESLEEPDMEFDTDDLLLDTEAGADEPSALKTKGIANKRIKVQVSAAATNAPFDFLDVEQWNEPVKNRFSYQRTQRVLKIKGLDIHEVEIMWDGREFLLVYKELHFRIPENDEFTRLNDTQIKLF